jgi:hypothetical protein
MIEQSMGNFLSSDDFEIFVKDDKYRTINISKYYSEKNISDEQKFMYFFCSYYNLKKLKKQISNVFNSDNFDFKKISYTDKFHKLCEIFSNDIKNEFKDKYSEELRNKNIKSINSKQIKNISNADTIRVVNNKNYVLLNNRTLVLYFRSRAYNDEQVDYLEFSIMYYILDWYINNGYSKVFNKLSVVSRNKEEYPKYLNYLFKKFNYSSVSDQDNSNVCKFKFETSIGANLVHFVDGDYWSGLSNYSTPIVSESIKVNKHDGIRVDAYKQNKVVLLKGIFYDRNNEFISKEKTFKKLFLKNSSRDRNTGDFYKLMRTMLDSVIELENKMIEDSNEDTVYELGELVGKSGLEASVYRIKGKNKLVAKIFKNNSLSELKKEFEIGKIFQRNGISVPKFIGIFKVKMSNSDEVLNGLVMEVIEDCFLIKNNVNIGDISRQIENTNSSEYILGKKLLEVEIEKFKKLPIKLVGKGNWGLDVQGLYSPLKNKIFLIDFGQMIVKEKMIDKLKFWN